MTSAVAAAGSNHPLAFRMAVIAGINQNITIACIFGSFSVLLAAVEARLGVGRELSTLGIPAVTLATAICAPLVGALATKFSLRLILLAGSILSTLGFVLLADSASFPLYLVAYGLLIGPGMAAGVILPAALVTRWYVVNRGRALGIVCAPVVIVFVPLVATRLLEAYGLPATYLALAALSAISVAANVFIVDRPPGSDAALDEGHGARGPQAMAGSTTIELLRTPRFWGLVFTFIASTTGLVVLTSHMVPMVKLWGISATLAATLLTIQSFVGVAGTVIFGRIADRFGGFRALMLIVFDSAILWALLMFKPGFGVAAVIVGLIGLHGGGVVPSLGIALSETFGRENFSRAYGLCNLVNLPFSVLCVPVAAMIFARTGSYAGVIVGEGVFLALTGLALLFFAVPRSGRTLDDGTLASRAPL